MRESLQDVIFTMDQFPALLQRAGGLRGVERLMPAIERWRRHPAGDFASVHSLAGAPLPRRAVLALRDVFIERVDAPLQMMYRAHLARIAPDRMNGLAERIATVDETRGAAFQHAHAVDWAWLANWLDLRAIGEDADGCLRRLSNFAFECTRVNLRFTYHCNIACRHCYNSSGPDARASRIDLALMQRIVRDMPGAGIGALNLSGGEPLLYLDDVCALVRAGRAAALRTISVYTNGFWAATRSSADRMLATLRAAGFMQGPGDHLKISAGVYHQEFIEFDRALTAAAAYWDAFARPLQIDFELASDRLDQKDEIRARIDAAGLTPRIGLHFRTVQPLGRGRDLAPASLGPISSPCAAIDQIVFDPDGAVRPCCGLNNENFGVVIGHVGRPLRQLIKSMQNDPILQFLSTHPMRDIFAYVDNPPRPSGYASTCALCQDAIGPLRDKEAIQRKLAPTQRFYPFWFDEK